ncbi:hypothetical protein ACFL6C_10815 [Myxococcota bacterium]
MPSDRDREACLKAEEFLKSFADGKRGRGRRTTTSVVEDGMATTATGTRHAAAFASSCRSGRNPGALLQFRLSQSSGPADDT